MVQNPNTFEQGAFLCHRRSMRTGRLFAALAPVILLTGCLQSTALIKVNADGSGTLENQTTISESL